MLPWGCAFNSVAWLKLCTSPAATCDSVLACYERYSLYVSAIHSLNIDCQQFIILFYAWRWFICAFPFVCLFVCLNLENVFAAAVPTVIAGGLINVLQSTSCFLGSPKFGSVWPFLQVFTREMGLKPTALIQIYSTLKSQLCRCLKQSQRRTEKKSEG